MYSFVSAIITKMILKFLLSGARRGAQFEIFHIILCRRLNSLRHAVCRCRQWTKKKLILVLEEKVVDSHCCALLMKHSFIKPDLDVY